MGADVSKFIDEEVNARRLNLSQKLITEIPSDVERFQDHLQRLDLHHNLLHSLPTEMIALTNLRFLNLKGNLFREFPVVLCSLPNLEILDMSRNKLRALPDDFGQLMSLKILSVANNRLRHLPRYLGDMKQLRILKLQHNPLNWPPHHVVESTPETDGSVWLDQLKLYLRENTLTNSDVNGDKQGSSDSEASDETSNMNSPQSTRHPTLNRPKASRDKLTMFIESARLDQASATTTATSDDNSCSSSQMAKPSTHRRSRPSNSSYDQANTTASSLTSPTVTAPLDEEVDDYPDTPVFVKGTSRTRRKSRENSQHPYYHAGSSGSSNGGARSSTSSNFHLRGASADTLLATSAAVHARRPSTDSSASLVGSPHHQRHSSSETLSSIGHSMHGPPHAHRLSREIIMTPSRLVNGSLSRLHGRHRSHELAHLEGGQHDRDDSLDSLASLDSQLTHITTPSVDRIHNAIPSNYLLNGSNGGVVVGTGTNGFSCEQAVETYFQRITGTAEVDLTSEPGRWLDAGRCMLFALSQAYTSLRILVAAQPDMQVTAILNGALKLLNDHVHQLVRCLVGFDRHVHQLRHQSSQRLEPGVCADLKKHCLSSVLAARRLMQTLRIHGTMLMRGVDVRLVRQALLAFHGVSYEIRLAAERLPCAAAMPPLARNPQNATAAPASLLGNVPLGLIRGQLRSSMRRTATAPSDANSRSIDVFNGTNSNGSSSNLSNTPIVSVYTPTVGTPTTASTSFSPKLIPNSLNAGADMTRSTTTTPMPITQPLVGQSMMARRPTAPEIRAPILSGTTLQQSSTMGQVDPSTATLNNLPGVPRDLERDAQLVRATEICINATSAAINQMRQVVEHYSNINDQKSTTNMDGRNASNSPPLNDNSSTRSLPRSAHLTADKLNELNRHLQQVCEFISRLQRSLRNFQSDTTASMCRRVFLDDAALFLKAVTRLSTAAKSVSLIFTLSRSAMTALQSMIQSTRELTLLVATVSGKMSPRPLLRNNTLPSGRTSPLPGGNVGSLEPIPSINVNGP